MIASLRMYDRPETAPALDHFWNRLRQKLALTYPDAPHQLRRDGDIWADWTSPDLLLAQTCGLPFRARLHGAVTLVGTPVYRGQDLPAGHYCSVIVARRDDPRQQLADFADATLAFNEPLSQSGWAAVEAAAQADGFVWTKVVQSGAHRASARAVASGQADVAALDVLSWQFMQRWDGFADALKVIARTDPTPGLPLITAQGRDPAPLFAAFSETLDALQPAERDILGWDGITWIDPAAYLALPVPPEPPSGPTL